MTIKEAAEHYGVSQQAIYQRLKKACVSLKTLKNPDTGELTPDGEAVINQLFNQRQSTDSTNLKEQFNELSKEVASLKAENEALKARVRDLEADKAYLQGQNTELLTRIPPALPAAGQTAQTEKRGFWARILGK